MDVRAYITEKTAALAKWESSIEERAHLKDTLAPWHARRDAWMQRFRALAETTSSRWEVLRMGFESAWAELRTAFETVRSKQAA